MKKKITIILIAVILLVVCGIIISIMKNKIEENKYSDNLSELITENSWIRDNGGDTEHISFGKDGKYVYYCDCGNPVGDSDLYEKYELTPDEREFIKSTIKPIE